MAGRSAPLSVGAADPDHPAERRPLEGLALDWFADLYYACAHLHHWTPTQVDACEVWEVYAALGHALSPGEWERLTNPQQAQRRGGRRRRGQPEQLPSSGRDLIAERVAWQQGRGPKPAPDDQPDARLAQIISRAPRA